MRVLLEFGLENFFSFREGVSISFKLDSNCPANISQGKNFTTVIGIKGANGSGKTHVLKGLAFLVHFCASSFSTKPEDAIGVDTFFDNDQPSELYAEFSINGIAYRYELSVTNTEVKRECIYKKNKKQIKILERINNELVEKTRAFARLDAIKLRKNASIISTAHQYGFEELGEIYDFFASCMSNVTYSGLNETPHNIYGVSKFLNENEEILKFVKSFIAECDAGISEIEIIEVKGKDDKEGVVQFAPHFVHEVDGEFHHVTQLTESSGTKALFRNLPSYKLVLDRGSVLILDEFDTHLHPHILPKLVQLFLNPKSNPKSAQLLFSTHDAEILNHLGRYRTYLVNKEKNESFAYRLDEIPGDILRNDRPILPAYNEGKIGGIPRL
jgi:AAA15 family ATPase/GTPase